MAKIKASQVIEVDLSAVENKDYQGKKKMNQLKPMKLMLQIVQMKAI